MSTPKYDWLKAVKLHPEDAATVIEAVQNEVAYGAPGNAMDTLLRAARVQTVAEAAIAYAEYMTQTAWGTLENRKIVELKKAYREARAREAAERTPVTGAIDGSPIARAKVAFEQGRVVIGVDRVREAAEEEGA